MVSDNGKTKGQVHNSREDRRRQHKQVETDKGIRMVGKTTLTPT